MSDQMRWFKLWYSALSDDRLLQLDPALRWAWAVMGAHTKLHGTHGKVSIMDKNPVLAAQMGVSPLRLRVTIEALPHVKTGPLDRYGSFTVTWSNWSKFQEDSTVAERMRALRSKRRGEESSTSDHQKQPQQPPRPMTSGELADERERVYQLSLRKPKAPA